MACKNCELCEEQIKNYYYDCLIPTYGQWKKICFLCFKKHNCSLGLDKLKQRLGYKIDALTGYEVKQGGNFPRL